MNTSSLEEIDMKWSSFIWASKGVPSVAKSANRKPINMLNCRYILDSVVDSRCQEVLSAIYKIES